MTDRNVNAVCLKCKNVAYPWFAEMQYTMKIFLLCLSLEFFQLTFIFFFTFQPVNQKVMKVNFITHYSVDSDQKQKHGCV